tara:strand:+ start:16 stop:177 length:162 start_codon:yes stop_codon:yes gene_type:complete
MLCDGCDAPFSVLFNILYINVFLAGCTTDRPKIAAHKPFVLFTILSDKKSPVI